jgi:hypothetical protein
MHDVIESPSEAARTVPVSSPSALDLEVKHRLQKQDFDELNERLLEMPREVGWLMVSIGVMGVALPGIVGTPALLAGGLMLWPKGFRAVNSWVRRRFPKTHEHGVEQLIRYLDDMERRYPSRHER